MQQHVVSNVLALTDLTHILLTIDPCKNREKQNQTHTTPHHITSHHQRSTKEAITTGLFQKPAHIHSNSNRWIPILIEVTRRPHDLSTTPMLLAVTPLPKPLTTPPVTNTYFIAPRTLTLPLPVANSLPFSSLPFLGLLAMGSECVRQFAVCVCFVLQSVRRRPSSLSIDHSQCFSLAARCPLPVWAEAFSVSCPPAQLGFFYLAPSARKPKCT